MLSVRRSRYGRRGGDRRSGRGRGLPGPGAGPPAGRVGRAGIGHDAGRPGRSGPAEGELPPEDPGTARPGGAGRGAPQRQRARADGARDRRVLRDLAGRARRGGTGPVPRPRPAVRAVAARCRRPAGARRRGTHHRRDQGGQARRHVRRRRSGAFRLRGGPGRLRRGTGDGGHRTGRQVPRRDRRARTRPSRDRGRPPEHQGGVTMDREPQIRKEIELDASPEEVWEAIATGPGITSWFMPHTVEPGEGGKVVLSAGDFTGESAITGWDPPKRFAVRSEGGQAFEYLIEGREGGSTVLRFVQSGFLGVRTSDGLYRFHGRAAFGMPIAVGHHIFARDVDQKKAEQAWQSWLNHTFS